MPTFPKSLYLFGKREALEQAWPVLQNALFNRHWYDLFITHPYFLYGHMTGYSIFGENLITIEAAPVNFCLSEDVSSSCGKAHGSCRSRWKTEDRTLSAALIQCQAALGTTLNSFPPYEALPITCWVCHQALSELPEETALRLARAMTCFWRCISLPFWPTLSLSLMLLVIFPYRW